MAMLNAASEEAATFCRYILSSFDELLKCLDGLSEEQLNWHPPAENTNSLYALAVHTMGNAEEVILQVLGGQEMHRNRKQEFLANGQSAQELVAHWQDLRPRIQSVILNMSVADMDGEYQHPRRGPLSGRAILLVVARHTALHLGHSELTRDLALAATTKK